MPFGAKRHETRKINKKVKKWNNINRTEARRRIIPKVQINQDRFRQIFRFQVRNQNEQRREKNKETCNVELGVTLHKK